jgi:hypothetical protein
MKDALPFGVGGGLVAIKTLLSRDPCVHANTAIEMIDAILKEHTAAQPAHVQEPVATVIKKGADRQWMSERLGSLPDGIYSLYTTPPAQPAVPDAMTSADIQEHIEYVAGWNDCRQAMMEMMK